MSLGFGDPASRLAEMNTIYANDEDRWIVSLIVGYSERDEVTSEVEALRWALDLTRDEGAGGTHWFVFDRKSGKGRFYEQDDFDPTFEEYRTTLPDGQAADDFDPKAAQEHGL